MRTKLLAAAAALAIVGGTAGALVARAAPPPPPPGDVGGPLAHGPHWREGMRDGPGGWHKPGHWHKHGHRLIAPGTFALLFHPANREITPADVQTIATGFLRWNGNHSWKVVDVQPLSGDRIGFAYAAADNTVVARFTLDSRTGHIQRVG